MCFNKFVVLVFLITSLINCSTSQSLQNATALRKYLFETNQYDKLSRPKLNQSSATEVSISLGLYAIYGLDEVAQTLKFAGFLDIEWIDETLVWDSSAFDGISSALYPQDMVWRPDLALKNSVEDYKALGDTSLTVNVRSSGLVLWQPYHVFTSMCLVDITYFPFDKQTCDIVFVTWGYNTEDIIVKSPISSSPVVTDYLQQNSEWNLVDATWETQIDPKPMMIYHLTLERKPQHVMSNIILPLIVLTILNMGVFILPCDSGERSGYAVTVFLSFVVFATIVQSTLPANSDSISYLSTYINIQIFESAAITILTLVCIRLNGLLRPVPKWLMVVTCARKDHEPTKRAREVPGSVDSCAETSPRKSLHTNVDFSIGSRGPSNIKRFQVLPYPIYEKKAIHGAVEDSETVEEDADWKRVVNSIDRIMLISLFAFNVVVTLIFFAIITK